MRLSSAIALFSFVQAALATLHRNSVANNPDTYTVVRLGGVEWVGNVQCMFYNEFDCQLSIHTNGRRIDGTTHNANEDVFLSCLTSRTSIALVIHNFTFADTQDYTCLEDATKEAASGWLKAAPIIEASGTFIHGQPLSLTCNAPPGSPLFWVLPGPSVDHQAAVITDTSNAVNASRTVTFILNNTDHFASYKCCIGLQTGQPPEHTCSSYTVVDSDSNSTSVITQNYQTSIFELTASVHSVFSMDPHTANWQTCYYVGDCYTIDPMNYTIENDPVNSLLSSHLRYKDDVFDNYCMFSLNTTDQKTEYSFFLSVARGFYYPLISQQPNLVYYKPEDGSLTFIMKFTIDANPEPTFTWFKQQTQKESSGTDPMPTGGRYTTAIVPVTNTRWEATLMISHYDPTQDNLVFTIHAQNTFGANWIDADTTVGPSYIKLVRSSNSTLSYTCTFESFPNPPIYEINVVAPYETNYTVVNQTLDPQTSSTTVNFDVGLDSRNTYYQLSCTVYNAYNSSLYQTSTLKALV